MMTPNAKPLPDPDAVDAALLPTEEDVARYERDGWYIAPQVVPHTLLDSVRRAIDEYHTGKRDRQLPREAKFSDWRPGDGDGVRNNEFCSLQNDGVRELVMLPAIGAIAARLARSEAIRLFDDQAIYKPPAAGEVGGTAVGWHTDHSYWSTCTSTSMLTAWIPLHDATVENGTLYVVDGSHLWPESEHLRGFNDPDLDSLERRMGRAIPKGSITPMELAKGQVSFHHMRAIHASAPNRAATPRFAVAVHMQDGANGYRPFATAAGVGITLPHDQLARRDAEGRPDYADPEIFPRIWPPREIPARHA
jgi:Phytanoyl-CoA dioxygenase (PhyH)